MQGERKGKGCQKGWPGRFHGCGYKLTVPREAVLDVLSGTSKHPSAEEIYFSVHKKYPGIGLATVYRTLELLVQLGLVFKFDFGDSKARYELVHEVSGEHHHHLVCKNCKRIINYTEFIDEEVMLLKKTEKGLSRKYNFKISDHIIQFYGICDQCQ